VDQTVGQQPHAAQDGQLVAGNRPVVAQHQALAGVHTTTPRAEQYSKQKKINIKFQVQKPVFRIHDILVWIRIRMRGSMSKADGSGSCLFRYWLQDAKKTFIYKFFCILLLEGTFTSFLRSHNDTKQYESMVFFNYFRYFPGGPKTYGSRSRNTARKCFESVHLIRIRIQHFRQNTDPDPEF
jgi:hypothetical protein